MVTTKTRVNISLSKSEEDYLDVLAKRDEMPRAAKVRQLMRTAMELEEDFYLNKLAEERDKPGVKYIPHDQMWAQVFSTAK